MIKLLWSVVGAALVVITMVDYVFPAIDRWLDARRARPRPKPSSGADSCAIHPSWQQCPDCKGVITVAACPCPGCGSTSQRRTYESLPEMHIGLDAPSEQKEGEG